MSVNVSFEFFPPNTPEGTAKLRATRVALAALQPEFFSVTYGAGGATREKTLDTVLEITQEGREVVPHISCIGAWRETMRELLPFLYGDWLVNHICVSDADYAPYLAAPR